MTSSSASDKIDILRNGSETFCDDPQCFRNIL